MVVTEDSRARTARPARARPTGAEAPKPPISDPPPVRRTAPLPAAARLRGWAPVVISALAMAAMGLWGIDRGSMYSTEEVSVWAARLPFGDLWHLLSHIDAAHGLYYVMMHAVLAAGTNEVLLRVPSVIGAVAAAALTARIAWRLSRSATVATLSGLIFAATPVLGDFAQVGRSYAIDVALVLAASLALLHATDAAARRPGAGTNQTWRRWALYGGLVVLAGYMHEMTILMLLAHGVTLLWARTDRATLRRWALTGLGAVVLMIPIILITHAQSSALGWITFRGWADVRGLVGGLLGPSGWSIGIMIGLMAVAVISALRPRSGVRARTSIQKAASHPIDVVRFALPLVVLPGATLIIESAVATPLYGGTRYVLYSAAAAAMLAAMGAYRLVTLGRRLIGQGFGRRAALAVVSAVVVLAVAVAGWPQQERLRTPEGRPQNNAAASAFVAAHAHVGDGILYLPAASGLAELAYQHNFAKVANIATAVSPERSGTFYGTPKRLAGIRTAVLARDRVWEFSDNGKTGMSPRQNAERRLLHRRFTLTLDRSYTGVRVMLWVKDSAQ